MTTETQAIKVTKVTVYPFNEGVNMGHVKALARVVLDDQLVLTGLRVTEGGNGLFVGYPNDPFYNGDEFRCIFYPVTYELRTEIEDAVLAKYQETVK